MCEKKNCRLSCKVPPLLKYRNLYLDSGPVRPLLSELVSD